MRLVILESPFAPAEGRTVKDHLDYLQVCLRDSIERGEAPFASHGLYPLQSGGPLDDGVPEDRERGIQAGIAWADRADAAVFYVDLGESPGMAAARLIHEARGLPIEERRIIPEKRERCRHCCGAGSVSGIPCGWCQRQGTVPAGIQCECRGCARTPSFFAR